MIKVIYALFLGLLIAIFIGVGVSVFYSEPATPTEPDYYSEPYKIEGDGLTESQQAEESAYMSAREAYDVATDTYNRNVSLIIVALAIGLLGVGLAFAQKIDVIADGVLYGGIFTLFYGMIRGLNSNSDKFKFLVIGICLAAVIALGYYKFLRKPVKEK